MNVAPAEESDGIVTAIVFGELRGRSALAATLHRAWILGKSRPKRADVERRQICRPWRVEERIRHRACAPTKAVTDRTVVGKRLARGLRQSEVHRRSRFSTFTNATARTTLRLLRFPTRVDAVSGTTASVRRKLRGVRSGFTRRERTSTKGVLRRSRFPARGDGGS